MIILVITNKKENTTTEISYDQIIGIKKSNEFIDFLLSSGQTLGFERHYITIEEINGEGFDLYS